MALYRQDIDFQGIFRKLGHNLEEIRIRALENITSKLEHHLICEQDIIHERHLIIRLLEWFNFTPCTKKEEVLRLLCQLSQHWGAAELIQNMGGIEFLTQLREDIETSLKPIVDQILENVLRLPELKSQDHAPDCIYRKAADSALWGTTLTSVDEASRSRVSMATATSQAPSIPSVTAEKLNRYDNPLPGYFDASVGENHIQGSEPDLRPKEACVGFKMSAFPWLPLTMTDRHVIISTDKSLQSKDPVMLISACEFLSDVVFQDFPAEIFIQRPQIVKSLMSLVGLAQHGGDLRLVVCAARTLSDLCLCLQNRIRYYQDPSLYTPKQEFGSSSPSTFSLTGSLTSQSEQSTDTRPSLVGWNDRRDRGDGRDGDSSDSASRDSSAAGEHVPGLFGLGGAQDSNLEELDSLQYQQLNLPQFAASVLLQSLQALRGTQLAVTTECLRLGFESWKILAVVVAEEMWSSGSSSARELVSKLKSCMETCSALLDSHHHSRCCSADAGGDGDVAATIGSDGDIFHHRLVYLGIASLLSHLLHLLPADQAVDIIPEQLYGNLGAVMFDESLALSYPQCHAVLTHFAQLLDLDSCRHFGQTVHIRQSMMDTCRFVLQVQSKALSPEEAVTLADSAVSSLPYHLHLNVITHFLAFFSHTSSRKSAEKSVLSRCSGVLLKLLSHPLMEVRQHTYYVLLTTIQSCLNAEKDAASGSYTGHLEARFILTSEIFYEIVCFGLADTDAKVCSSAIDLLFHLLQSRVLLGDLLWAELITSLSKSLPVLQSYTDMKTRFGRRLWSLLDPAIASDNLSLLDKLRGNLRLMFSPDSSLREEAVKRLCWFLANESGANLRLPNMSGFDLHQLAALFIVENPHYLDEDNTRSVFQPDGLKQVYDIFIANPVDAGVKKSASDQLAIMLQDPHLHAVFRASGGLEAILSILHQSMTASSSSDLQSPNIPVVPACVTMLRHLLHHDYTLRRNLSHDPTIYYDLVRVSMSLVRDENVSYQVSHILVLLLFDEVTKFDVSSTQSGKTERNFSLPAVVTKRYRLPFRPAVHHSVSPNSVLLPPENDILKTPMPQEMLRVAWNVAWCGGLDNLLQLMKAGGSKLDELRDFSKEMILTRVDRTVLQSSGLRWGMQEGLYIVANATSHADVIRGLTRILALLATIPSAECAELLNQLDWSAVLDRFLQVMPSSPQDETLLLEVVRFMNCVLKVSPYIPQAMSQWLCQRLYNRSGPLLGLLTPAGGEEEDASDTDIAVKRSLDKVLLQFITVFMSRLPYKLHMRQAVSPSRGDLARKLLLRLNISAAPHFYNLAALEGTLVCLVHLTARPGWSCESCDMDASALCCHVLNCLLEVVSAFDVGRGGTAMSFMGKGVTKAATLCLRQLAFEMVSFTQAKYWAKNWLYSRQGADAVAEPGLNWMLTLWAYRDAEVRAAGVGIAVALASTEGGRLLLSNNCKHIPGGIWGAAFSILLDPTECSMVRQQAALLLVNLTSETIPNMGAETTAATVWQGPVVMDVDSNVSLAGLSALLALLSHSHFYQQFAGMLGSFFPASVLQPVLVTTQVPLHSLDASLASATSSVGSTPRSTDQHTGQSVHQATDQETGTSSAKSTGRSGYSTTSQQQSQGSNTTGRGAFAHTGMQLDSSSSSSQDGRADEDAMSSIVTPCLVAAVCQLLGNLVVMAPNDIFNSLASHNILNTVISLVNTSQLQELCQQLSSGPHRTCSLLTLRDLLRMYNAIVCLLATAVRMNSPARASLLSNLGALKAFAALLLLQCHSTGDLVLECRQLWRSVILLFSGLLQTQSAAAMQCLTVVLTPIWADFCDALVRLLEARSEETRELISVVTAFLSLLLTEEGKQLAKDPRHGQDCTALAYLLDESRAKKRAPSDMDADKGSFTTGASLSKVLVNTYELTSNSGAKVGLKSKVSEDRMQVIITLKSLFVVSQSATHAALDMGLVETLIEAMKQAQSQLNLDSLQVGRNTKRKDDGLLQELVYTISILRNMLYGNEDVKLACAHSGLGSVVHKLWAWCLQEPGLMAAVLALLVNFTARCPTAATSLAQSTSGAVNSAVSRQHLMASSLVVAITKAMQREVERELAAVGSAGTGSQVRLFFTLLTSLSLSSECRSLIWKSNLLQDLSKLSPGRSRKSRSRQLLDSLWLELAVALSFSTDGQQMLLRLDECLTVLLDFVENGFGMSQCQEYAMLILRNLCCHVANKPKILANDQVIPCCVDLVESAENARIRTLAASAVWALAYNNHKAKVALKNVNVIPRMQVCLKNVQLSGSSIDDVLCAENIQAIITTVSS